MRQRHYELDGEKIPSMFATPIILRMFGDDKAALRHFVDTYKANKHAFGAAIKEPTELDLAIAEAYQNKRDYPSVAKEFAVSVAKVRSTVLRVARHKFLNG